MHGRIYVLKTKDFDKDTALAIAENFADYFIGYYGDWWSGINDLAKDFEEWTGIKLGKDDEGYFVTREDLLKFAEKHEPAFKQEAERFCKAVEERKYGKALYQAWKIRQCGVQFVINDYEVNATVELFDVLEDIKDEKFYLIFGYDYHQ